MPVSLADYGVAVFALGSITWVIVSVFGPKRNNQDLVKVISDNTRALTELSTLVRQQTELLRQQSEMIAELRLEVARKDGRTM